MRIRIMATGAALGIVTLAGCGSDGAGSGAEREQLVQAMVSEGATETQADCFIDRVGEDDAQRIFEADDAELSESDMEAIERALAACDPEAMGAATSLP
jgi:hypothetical protein